MANTYTQLYTHVVFSVKGRGNLIGKSWKNKLYKYITGIIKKNGHKLLAINGMPDHIHILMGVKPNQSLSDLMQDIKAYSAKWINQNRFVVGQFSWQLGYGAFSYSRSQIDRVIKYIMNQEVHHARVSFKREYVTLLKAFGIDYNERYLFNFIDDK